MHMIKLARVCLSQQNMLISNAYMPKEFCCCYCKASGGGSIKRQKPKHFCLCIGWIKKSKHVSVICQNHVTIFVSFILFAKEKQGGLFFLVNVKVSKQNCHVFA